MEPDLPVVQGYPTPQREVSALRCPSCGVADLESLNGPH
jgi:hypothetical protein